MIAQQSVGETSVAQAVTYVKNTFITIGEFGVVDDPTRRRANSLPPSQRFFIGEAQAGSEKASDDASTDCCTNTEMESPLARSEDAASDARTDDFEEDLAFSSSESSPGLNYNVSASHMHSQEMFATLIPFQPATCHVMPGIWGCPEQLGKVMDPPIHACFDDKFAAGVQCSPCSKSSKNPKGSRLKSSASAFEPRGLADKSSIEPYADEIEQVMRGVEQAMKGCNYPADVECFQGERSWSILIKLHSGDSYHMEHMLTVAKGALLEACEASRSIYVMGYRTPQPFTNKDQGFEATLGAMTSPTRACWHIFKKGSCRHGSNCSNQHPASLVPISVYVECIPEKCVDMTKEYAQQVADGVQRAASGLLNNPYTVDVKTVKIASSNEWTIEAAIHHIPGGFQHICFSAKEALMSAFQFADNVVVMGAGSKSSFAQQGDGFEVTLGGMRQKSNACWDLCRKGFCLRDVACRWEHPEFYGKVVFRVVFHTVPYVAFCDYSF